MSFVKLFEQLLNSSVWEEDAEVRVTWVTMLLLSDRNGNVYGTRGAIARRANLPQETVDHALDILCSPDPNSTSPDEDGMRIVAVGPNLWSIVNYQKYRELRDPDEERRKTRERVRKHRAMLPNVTPCNAVKRDVTKSNDIADADADTEAEAEGSRGDDSEETIPTAWWFREWKTLTSEIPTMPAFRTATDNRKAALRQRIREHGEEGMRELLAKVRESKFLRNEVPPPPDHPRFKVDVDWVLNQANAAKILEGKYNQRAQQTATVEERMAEYVKKHHPTADAPAPEGEDG